jgi:hypothetical protein
MLLAVIEIAATAFAISNKGKFHDTLEKILNDKVGNWSDSTTRDQLKPIQELFHCCGSTLATQKLFIDGGNCPGDQRFAVC